ncbi:MAG: division/cell wall cluster transcriptional repressor MraZ [Anaerolineae bacterium]|nr:division/cell wall cluster transcriptional repressor MraZ [Anaerolineae bacterium]
MLTAKVEQMFLGQYRHNLDAKGRLTIPARFREQLAEGAYLTQGFDRNLRLLTIMAFETTYQQVGQLSMTDPTVRELRRLLFANASLVEVDRIGRILVPQFLRSVAALNVEVVIVGVGEEIEIWSPEVWEEQDKILQDSGINARRYTDLDVSI